MRMYPARGISQSFWTRRERIGKPFTFRNNLPGTTQFTHLLVEIAKEKSPEKIYSGMEAASVYSWHLHNSPLGNKELDEFDLGVSSFNLKFIKHFKRTYPNLDTTDTIDTFETWARPCFANRLRFARLPAECKSEGKYVPLRRLTRFRNYPVKSLVREKNHWRNLPTCGSS